jgi:AcrR family transcriptional regulator
MRLFAEHGYSATTVEQIAEAAEVSPSTFFRYFGSKEDVVVRDKLDPLLIEAFHAQPPEVSPIAAVRAAICSVFAQIERDDLATFRLRHDLMQSVPELRAMLIDEFTQNVEMIAAAVAQRVGRDRDDVEVRNWAGAVVGVLMATAMAQLKDPDWSGSIESYMQRLDAALAHLEAGLPL